MSATLREVREGLAANLSAAFGDSVQVSAWMLENPSDRCFHVYPGDSSGDAILYHTTSGGRSPTFTVTVEGIVALVSDIGGQQLLDEMLDPDGPNSVRQAIEADSTLGGTVADLIVTKASGYRVFVIAGMQKLGSQWTVEVYA